MSLENWRSDFIELSPAYSIFSWLPDSMLSNDNWPSLDEYNDLTGTHYTMSGLPIQFVQQNNQDFSYESFIYLTGKVQTRSKNWHDFFNMLMWHTFPNIKSALNAKHFQHVKSRSEKTHSRSPIENLLTLFDESGIIVTSSDSSLLELIKNMSWKELFWSQREQIQSSLRFFIFGHSIYEKLLNPYVGLVGHSLLMHVDQQFIDDEPELQIINVNKYVKTWIDELPATATPKMLSPLPILGFPGWYSQTDHEKFYDNKEYFRNARKSN